MVSTRVLYQADPASVRLIECSPPSWMVALLLEEKGLAYTSVLLSFAKGEHRTAAMLARNPRGTIPVLEDDGAVIHETFAIVDYVERSYPDPALLPRERHALALALTRLHEANELKAAGMRLFAYLMKTPDGARDEPAVTTMQAALLDEAHRWERVYEETPFAAGHALSLADLAVFVYAEVARRLSLLDDQRGPALASFCERMKQRPSVQRTWPWA